MSRLPFLWPSVILLLIFITTSSILHIFLSLPIPQPAHSPADTHSHDDHPAESPSTRSLPPQAPYTFPPSAAAVHAAIAASDAVLDNLSTLTPADATVETVLLPLAATEASLMGLVNTLTILSLASPTDEVLSLLTQLNEHLLRTSAHASLPPLLSALHDNTTDTADPETAHYIHAMHTSLLHTGAALSAEQQARLELLQERMSNLTSTFQHNLITATASLPVTGLNMTGVPASAHPAGLLPLTPRSVGAVLSTAADPRTRRVVWAAAENSVPDNVPVFQELIGARHEAAAILGYEGWAAMRLGSGRLVPDAGYVRGFLAEARDALRPVGAAEAAEMAAAIGSSVEEYGLWDKRFAERAREKAEGSGMVFVVEEVLAGVLDVVGGVFGLVFEGPVGEEEWAEMRGVKTAAAAAAGTGGESAWDDVRDGEDAVKGGMAWHEDVQLFAVWDAPSPARQKRHGGDHHEDMAREFVGYLYLDLLARPTKTSQAGNLNIVPGYHHPHRPRHYPSTAILTTFPATGRLSHTELIVLFHELGHAVHDLVSRSQFSRHHGPVGVPVDFAEVPSRLAEEFAWDVGVLVGLGADPAHARAVVDARWEGAALAALRGVHIAAFDMGVHGGEPPSSEDETGALYNQLRREVIPVNGGEVGERLDGYATFGHLAMGYDAGYYGYLVSSCWAADVWGVFEEQQEGDEGWAGVGRRWRAVLEVGGVGGVGELVQGFLGRGAGCGVFYRRLGVEGVEGA